MGAHAILANGGVMAPCGAHLVALAAKRHSVPFVVLAGLHKLSPLFPHDPSVTFNDFKVCPGAQLMDLPLVFSHRTLVIHNHFKISIYAMCQLHKPNPEENCLSFGDLAATLRSCPSVV